MVVDWGCLSSVVIVARRGRCESRIATSVIVSFYFYEVSAIMANSFASLPTSTCFSWV
jgi:hypothetical protein